MAGEDPEGEATVLDDRLAGAARIPDSPDRVAGERPLEARGDQRIRRIQGRHSGRAAGEDHADWEREREGIPRREEEAVEEVPGQTQKGRGVRGMHERSSNPRRMHEEHCRRSIQSPPSR